MTCTASERLREMLEQWKDEWWISEIAIRSKFRDDPHLLQTMLARVPPWRSYEKVVLNNAIRDFDSERFAGLDAIVEPMERLHDSAGFPADLFYWNRESRRVYILEAELQERFALGTYPDLKWPELKWPLDYFLLTLEKPMIAEDRLGVWVKYDTIFACRTYDGKNEMITMRVFREPTKDPQRDTYRSKLEAAQKCFTRGDYDRGGELFMRAIKNFDREMPTRQGWRKYTLYQDLFETRRPGFSSNPKVRVDPEFFLEQMARSHPVHLSYAEEDLQEHAEQLSILVKMIVGTCLYINSISSPLRSRPLKRPPGFKGVTGIITDATHICDVICKGTLDPTVYGLFEPRECTPTLFVRPHSRRGFWRRPAGSPPNAAKTIWVPHTIVRKDLIPEYGLMSGTETKIRTDE